MKNLFTALKNLIIKSFYFISKKDAEVDDTFYNEYNNDIDRVRAEYESECAYACDDEDFTEDNSFCTETIEDDLSDLDFIDEEDYCSTNRCAECVVLNHIPPCQDSISSTIQWEDELEHGKVIVTCNEYIGECIPDLCHYCWSCSKQEHLQFTDK